jgi:serine/threonine protein phosphatase PrpC
MMFSVFQVSRMGGRKRNEDRMGYTYTQGSVMFLVADGLGGHPQGDVASQICLQVATSMFHKQAVPKLADVAQFLQAVMLAAHEQLLSYAATQGLEQTPSSTLVLAVLQDNQCHTAHCGDSRRYLVRGGAVLSRTLKRCGDQLTSSLHCPYQEVAEKVRILIWRSNSLLAC